MINTSKTFPITAHSFSVIYQAKMDEGDVSYKHYWRDEASGELMGGWEESDICIVNKDEDMDFFQNECDDFFFVSRP